MPQIGSSSSRTARRASAAVALAAAAVLVTDYGHPPPARAFTQSGLGFGGLGSTIPMGHEWLTRRAAIELLLGTDPKVPNDPKDPRRAWKSDPKLAKGLAKNLDLSSSGAQKEVWRIKHEPNNESAYASTYEPVFDAILGERWVDIAGINVFESTQRSAYDCFDAAVQEPAELQYDHFMRRYDDADEHGGVNAAKGSAQRFINYFIAAAMAPETKMLMWDGGGSVTKYTVDRNYFLLGRVMHLLQDSFSLEHVVRIPDDNYAKIRQVKSYLCATGSEQHSHLNPTNYANGDVIWNASASWKPGWSSYLPSAMRINALVAMEASKDLWAAFIRTMGTPTSQRADAAKKEAETLASNWLHFDESEMLSWYANKQNRGPTYVLGSQDSAPGQTQDACVLALDKKGKTQADIVASLKHDQQVCLYNMEPVPGYDDLWDSAINMPFYWKWKTGNWTINYLKPPAGWTPPPHQADYGKRVTIQMVGKATQSISVKSLAANTYVKLDNNPPLSLIVVGDPTQGAYLRATLDPTLFLSYTAGSSGQVKLWNGTTDSAYIISDAGSGKSILNTYWKQYMWYDKDGSVHVTKDGKATSSNAQWAIPGL